MYRIIDGRGTGKTSRLMLLARENDGVIVCAHPEAMRQKAHAYSIVGIDFYSYYDFIQNVIPADKPIFIDELEGFLKFLDPDIQGYTLSNED